MRVARFYLSLALRFGVGVGLAVALSQTLVTGLEAGVKYGAFLGAVSGILMSAAVGTLHLCSVRRLSPGAESALRVHHRRTVEVELPYEEAFDRCTRSLDRIPGSEIRTEDRSTGEIRARRAMTMSSWRDLIVFQLHKSERGTRIEVSSRPAMRTTAVDYGQNLENVEKIVQALTSKSSPVGA